MTRKEAHTVVERWNVRPTYYAGLHWTGAPYKGVQAFSLTFSDRSNLLRHPSKEPWEVLKAEQLSPEVGRERLQHIHLAFESIRGTEDTAFRETLKERYGEPTTEARDSLLWIWPEENRSVTATFNRSGGRLFLTLYIGEGQLRTMAVTQALLEQRREGDRDQEKDVLAGLAGALPKDKPSPTKGTGKPPGTQSERRPVAETAKRCGGVWRITGFSKAGQRFEGILELHRDRQNPDGTLHTILTWLDGPFAGVNQEIHALRADVRRVTVSVGGKVKRGFDILVLRGPQRKTPEGFPVPPPLFAALVSADGRKLEYGASMDYSDIKARSVLAASASEPDAFHWRSTRPSADPAAQTGKEVAGVWHIEGTNVGQKRWRGEFRFSANTLAPGLARLRGTYADSEGGLHPMHGYFDLDNGRATLLVDFPRRAHPAEVRGFGHYEGGGTDVYRLRFTAFCRPDDRRIAGMCSPVLQVGGIVAPWRGERE
jgi:hypothetical protein